MANTNTSEQRRGEVMRSYSINRPGETYYIFRSKNVDSRPLGGVIDKPAGQVEVRDLVGGATSGPVRALPVSIAPMDAQIFGPVAMPEQD